ncbi:PREDICTED: leucine-rich repeat-containing protein 40-like [Trachymyrmex cornetzi]|uniref:leucine-rich repeat-containing protein 40-like n=1 Tax=Trachymyrmex cornetzi TaxID=471704 RepID=UPI00084ED563|nr:PREDICTED: leucine-rich repeat-containing protein 40-like [Trachymyrmex cornetzi]
MTFNNSTKWLNLTDVNISNNKIDVLPRKLGALHCLRRLNLSHNCLRRFEWAWLKKTHIKRTLHFLDISNNSLIELSEYIWNLNALVELKLSHNLLGYLPQGIEKLRNLRTLDLSHNFLKYLPAGITNLKLQTIDISMNPLVSDTNWECDVMLPSLAQFAAKTLQQYCRDKHVIFRRDELNEYISRNKIDNCFHCGKMCTSPYLYLAWPRQPILTIATNVISHTSKMSMVFYELCCCFPECKGELLG